MKKSFIFLMIFMTWNCSNFQDDYNLILDLNQPLDKISTNLPIINIVVDENEFNYIYENFEQDIEVETARFNLYRNNKLVIESEEIELNIKGNFSKKFPLKSLGVKFEDKYDNSDRSLIKPKKILPHHSIDKIKSIRLRNSGNDFARTMIKDLSYTALAIDADLDLDLAYSEPSLVFINNEFYGLLNIRTEVNAHGMAGLYDEEKDKLTLGKTESAALVKKNGDFNRIDALVQAIENKNITFLKEEIDLNNFIDYMIFQSYISNIDWPHSNVRFYAIQDGKFRFVMYDVDAANELLIKNTPLEFIDHSSKNIISDLFLVLYENDDFKQNFWTRYKDLLNSNLISSEKFETIIDSNIKKIELEISVQIEKYQAPETMAEWYFNIKKLSDLFQEREQIVKTIVRENF